MSKMLKPVELVWLDSGLAVNQSKPWMRLSDLVERGNLATVRTIGYLAGEDDEAFYLVQTYDPADEEGMNMVAIAKQNVKEFNDLRRR